MSLTANTWAVSPPRPRSRRTFLQCCGVALGGVLAGCQSSGADTTTASGPPRTTTTNPRSPPTATTTGGQRCVEPPRSWRYVFVQPAEESRLELVSERADVVAIESLDCAKRDVVREATETGCRVPTYEFRYRDPSNPDVVRVGESHYWLQGGVVRVAKAEDSSE